MLLGYLRVHLKLHCTLVIHLKRLNKGPALFKSVNIAGDSEIVNTSFVLGEQEQVAMVTNLCKVIK